MILSIQSNVMHGSVGNRASLPIYQAFGIETNHLDTVRLAAHPGHGTTARDTISGDAMRALFDDYLKLPDASQPAAIHIGYFGALSQIAPTADFIQSLKQRYPAMRLMLDPVFGDHGKAYISADMIEAIITTLVPLADIITPNQFELATLSGQSVTSQEEAANALTSLAQKTSAQKTSALIVATGIDAGDNIADMICDKGQITGQHAPKKAQGVSGSGDAFAALFLSYILANKTPQQALELASHLTHHMIAHSKSPLTLNLSSGLSHMNK